MTLKQIYPLITAVSTNNMKNLPKYLTAALLLLALASWPYAYYMFLRVVVFFVFGYYAVQYWQAFDEAKKKTAWWVWVLGFIALLFNPFFPAHLTREIWSVFNVAAALLLLATIRLEKKLLFPIR